MVQARLLLNHQPVFLSGNSSETVNDGRFHTVELVTFNRMVNLSVDGGEPMTLDSEGRSQPGAGDAPLYVGGKRRRGGSADRRPPQKRP